MQKTKKDCLTPGVEHDYQFVISQSGVTMFRCFCGEICEEFEDAQL
jgi:hypothetical protein